MSNAEIVLGSLMSRLFFVLILLCAGLPVFCIAMLYGGVTASEIFLSFGLAGASAVLTGSLAIAISVIKVGTRRTIFSFYLMIAVYLTAVFFLAFWPATHVPEAPASPGSTFHRMSWLSAFHPFLSLWVALNLVHAPPISEVMHYGWPAKYLLAYPHYSYIVLTLLVSLVLVVFSMFFVRRGAREGEMTLSVRIREFFRPDPTLGRRRNPRNVWSNPVAWREAATRASAASRSLLRYVYIGGGAVAAVILLLYYANGWAGFTANVTRAWLMVFVMIEFATVLLVGTNTAATAITREREANTMDLLLCTPLTSRYIIWGKLRGLVSFTLPLIAVPVSSVLLFALYDLLAGTTRPVVHFEVLLELAALLVVYSAFACMIGLQASLKSKKTVHAVLLSVGVVVLVCFALWSCGIKVVGSLDEAGAVLAPFTPFTAIAMAVNPHYVLEAGQASVVDRIDVRVMGFIGSALAVTIYTLIVAALYTSMVRNFDMAVRKQSA